ncbi:MAG: TonB-dependent receptor [Deltaproteobacteria bacterium]|nr:TonB-dependent receptor [Deltaproteobacteria bacterium]
MKVDSRIRFSLGLALVAGLTVPSGAWAQAGKAKAAPKVEAEIEEITVTAQKREESIQEIPVSVTALGSAQLEQRGVTDVADIGQAAPNVRITTNPGSASSVTVAIRGVTSGNPSTTLSTPTGLYIDGVYLAKLSGSNVDVEDLERVEVLRGPQGTLYGRNTIAGAVNFITKKPTEEKSISLKTEAGNYETFKSRLMVNVPLVGKNGFWQSDAIGTLSLRQNVAYKTHDGYFDNSSPTSVPAGGARTLNNLNRVFTMTTLRWQPIEPLTIDGSFEYHRYSNSSNAFQLTYIYPGSIADKNYQLTPTLSIPNPLIPGGLPPYVRTNRVDAIGNNAVYESLKKGTSGYLLNPLADDGFHRLYNLTAAYELGEVGPMGKVTLKSISAFRDFTHKQTQDLDGSPVHLLDLHSILHTQQWSEELQWVGTMPRINYVGGLYYYGEYSAQDQSQVFVLGNSDLPYRTVATTASYAPYGQITYTPPILQDKLSITAGLRYTQDQIHTDRYVATTPSQKGWEDHRGKAFGIHGAGAPGLSPMANLAYQWTDDFMTYFRVARGFKAGGFNGTTNDPAAFAINFNPEILLQYELGFKSQWLDKRLRVNATGFYSDYTDIQQSIFQASVTGGAVSTIGNADSAEIWGSELEVVAVPLQGVEASATYALALPKFLEWNELQPNGQYANVARERVFAMTPEHQATIGLTYTAPPTSVGTFAAHLDGYWQDYIYFVPNSNTAGAQADKGWNYALFNGRLQFTEIPLTKGSLDLSVFCYNLFDRKYRSYGIDFGSSLGIAGNQYGTPRTFGIGLNYNFTAS